MAAIWFMPWAGLKAELDIGGVKVFPWSGNEERVKNIALRKEITNRFEQYVDQRGKPTNTICVVSLEPFDLRALSPEEVLTLRRAVDILTFCCIAECEYHFVGRRSFGLRIPSSEQFLLYGQQINVGDRSVGIATRKILAGWSDYRDISFPQPLSARESSSTQSRYMLLALSELLKQQSCVLSERIFLALEWFRLAHFDDPDIVSDKQIAVAIETAVETAVGGGDTKLEVGERLDEICEDQNLKRRKRVLGRKQKEFEFTELCWWFIEFYDIRSAIVHGNPLSSDQLQFDLQGMKLPKALLCDLILREVIGRLLHKHGLMNDLELRFLGFGKVHEAVGWSVAAPAITTLSTEP